MFLKSVSWSWPPEAEKQVFFRQEMFLSLSGWLHVNGVLYILQWTPVYRLSKMLITGLQSLQGRCQIGRHKQWRLSCMQAKTMDIWSIPVGAETHSGSFS